MHGWGAGEAAFRSKKGLRHTTRRNHMCCSFLFVNTNMWNLRKLLVFCLTEKSFNILSPKHGSMSFKLNEDKPCTLYVRFLICLPFRNLSNDHSCLIRVSRRPRFDAAPLLRTPIKPLNLKQVGAAENIKIVLKFSENPYKISAENHKLRRNVSLGARARGGRSTTRPCLPCGSLDRQQPPGVPNPRWFTSKRNSRALGLPIRSSAQPPSPDSNRSHICSSLPPSCTSLPPSCETCMPGAIPA